MKIGHTIDSNGYLTGDILDDSKIIPNVTVPCPDGLYKPQWLNGVWVEGLTQSEIDMIKNAPKRPSTEDRLAAAEAALLSLMGL